MIEHTGWLLDVYADSQAGGLVVWLLGDDGARRCLRQAFPRTFYAAGGNPDLRAAWRYLKTHPARPQLARTERRELFSPQPLTVLSVTVPQAAAQPRVFADLLARFPHLDYYDADLPLQAQYAADYNVFPLTRCRVQADAEETIQAIEPLGSRWELDAPRPPLRVLHLRPDCDPGHTAPQKVLVRYGRTEMAWPLEPARPLLVGLAALLKRFDPDLILTLWGDTWLLPHWLEQAQKLNLSLPFNRDPRQAVRRQAAHTYFTYGQVVHRGEQVTLFGRWHVDGLNAMMYGDYGMEARVSGLPVQTAARRSPGAGITAMHVVTALRQDILVPYRKQQTEFFKDTLELIRADQGGLVYQPTIGLHANVGEIDFVSMYPSIIRQFNISPETVGGRAPDAASLETLPSVEASIDEGERPGLLPLTLAPLLDRRIALKGELATMHPKDCRYLRYKAQSAALKWLLVVCFGYTGYKNAKFGRIEAHQAITAYAREALLRAKEAAEDQGFTVLHMYIDGLWVQKPGADQVSDFHPLLEEVSKRTRLPIALDGIYSWVAFLPSKADARVPVPNRYFGIFQNGSVKVRGIEARRGDTPPYLARLQHDMLAILAQAPTAADLPETLPKVAALLDQRLRQMRRGRVPLEDLLVRQRLSRALEEYKVPSPAAEAAAQLEAAGKPVPVGRSVRFLYLRGKPRLAAWDLPDHPPNPAALDTARYFTLFLRAAAAVLEPLGVSPTRLEHWLRANAGYGAPPGYLPEGAARRLPLWY